MNEADILAMTYEDLCTVKRMNDFEDVETNITSQEYVSVYEDVSCALSQTGLGQAGGLAVVEDADMLNVTISEYRLFTKPDIQFVKGDKVIIKQRASGKTFTLYAKEPFYYPSHCEVNLTGRDPNG